MKKNIQYSYVKIKENQFAVFEENFVESNSCEMEQELKYHFDSKSNIVECCNTIQYLQNSNIVLKLSVSSYFKIEEKSFLSLKAGGKYFFPQSFMIQLASLNYGTMRGIIYEKCVDNSLKSLVLPPFYFDEIIKDDVVFAEE